MLDVRLGLKFLGVDSMNLLEAVLVACFSYLSLKFQKAFIPLTCALILLPSPPCALPMYKKPVGWSVTLYTTASVLQSSPNMHFPSTLVPRQAHFS